MQAQDREVVAGHEVTELVEHAVVGQMVLGVPGRDLAAPQHRGRVLRLAGGPAQPRRGVAGAVEIADDDGQLAGALVGQPAGEPVDGRAGGLRERAAQHEVLGRIAGERHLREGHQVRAGAHRPSRPGAHQVRVRREIADGGVDLGKRDAQLGHESKPSDPGSPAAPTRKTMIAPSSAREGPIRTWP